MRRPHLPYLTDFAPLHTGLGLLVHRERFRRELQSKTSPRLHERAMKAALTALRADDELIKRAGDG